MGGRRDPSVVSLSACCAERGGARSPAGLGRRLEGEVGQRRAFSALTLLAGAAQIERDEP